MAYDPNRDLYERNFKRKGHGKLKALALGALVGTATLALVKAKTSKGTKEEKDNGE